MKDIFCKVMYDFVKKHTNEIVDDYKSLGFKDAADLLHQIKTDVTVASWALEELCDWGMKTNYRKKVFMYEDFSKNDFDYVYSVKDNKNNQRFFIIENDIPIEVVKQPKIIEVWMRKN